MTQTRSDLSQHVTRRPDLHFGKLRLRGVRVIHVDDRMRYQRVTGFGAAMTDSSAWLIHDQLQRAARNALMNALFGSDGIHLEFVRVPIGASDFTAGGQPNSYDDLPPGQSDPQLLHFSVAHDKAYILPALRQILRIDPRVEILANPWSPPAWMKGNHAFDDLFDLGTLPASSYQPLASYFVRFLEAYAQQGVPVVAITPQNEPQAGTPYPGLDLPAADEAQFILRNLRPALRAAGLHPKI